MAGSTQTLDGRRGNRWRAAIWGTAACLLLLPLVAMQFTAEVNWDGTDFIVMGGLLFGACGLYEFAARMSGSIAYRAASGIAIVTGVLLVWINLAVGIIGSEDNPANLVFFGVLAIGMLGAFVARLRPRGMALTLGAMAIAQVLAAVYAAVVGPDAKGAVLSGFFAVVWLVSAQLFRLAARQDGSTRGA